MAPRARQRKTDAAIPAVANMTETQPSISSPTVPSRMERIAERAYAIYQRRGGEDGSSLDDWLQAEREVDAEIDAGR